MPVLELLRIRAVLEVLLEGVLADMGSWSDGRDGSLVDDCVAVGFSHDCGSVVFVRLL